MFKRGDKVLRTQDTWGDCKKGEIYTVSCTYVSEKSCIIKLEELDKSKLFDSNFFRIVNTTKSTSLKELLEKY